MNKEFELIADNALFVVIYKKPGVSFHSDTGDIGLFECVKQSLSLAELYPVHRLDKVTSGILLMAKTAAVNKELVEQFANRSIEKFYLAISAKKPKKKQGLIKGDMAIARRGAWKLIPTLNNPAVTQFFSASISPGYRLFIVKPHTGKTHQIRVALKSIGAPIWGDSLYADSESSSLADRVYLHSYSLSFSLFGKSYRYTELPREGSIFLSEEFLTAIKSSQNPWLLSWPLI